MLIGILAGLIILVILVTVHELGHAIVAYRNGVTVEEFGIGFPPRAWSRKLRNGVTFSLNWLPLGGFVKLKGEHDADTEKGSFGAATFWQKTKIMFAGVMMNWLVAAVILTVLAWVGLPKILPNQFSIAGDTRLESSQVMVASVLDDSPASKAQFEPGDEIVAFNGQEVVSAQQFVSRVDQAAGTTVKITLEHDGERQTRSVTLNSTSKPYAFGASLGQSEKLHATWSAPIVGAMTTAQLSWETLAGLGNTLVKLGAGFVQQFSPDAAERDTAHQKLAEVSDSVAGPVGILGVIFPAAQRQGVEQLAFLTAIISLTLAVINALPIPALDGGRWWAIALFRARRKALTPEKEESIQAVGMLILFGLIIMITVADIGKVL